MRLLRLAAEYFGQGVAVRIECLEREPRKSQGELDAEMQAHPVVSRVRDAFEVSEPAAVFPRGRR